MDEDRLPKNPNQEWAQLLFEAHNPDCTANKAEAKSKLMEVIKENNAAPFYKYVCEVLKEKVDQSLYDKMAEANKKELAEMDKKIEDTLGQTEKRDAMMARAEYLCTIGDKEAALTAFRETSDVTVSLGQRMDIVFYQIRMGLFYSDMDLVKRNLEKAEDLLKQGGDWDRRNRLKVYRGTYSLFIRDFDTAAKLFLETVSTFTSVELMEYKDFVAYTVLAAVAALGRPDVKAKVVHGPEIRETLHELPDIDQYLMALYNCQYDVFFKSLADIETKMKNNRLFAAHYRYYVREMRVLAYRQLLDSYRSVTLSSMAKAFGVSESFIDAELSRFVAAGRLNCKIDKVGGVVETTRPDRKNSQYQNVIKQGDILLNNIQKLSQVANI